MVDIAHDVVTLEGIAAFQQQLLAEIRSPDRPWSQREIVGQVALINGCIRRREAWEKLQVAKTALERGSGRATPRIIIKIADWARIAPPPAEASSREPHEALVPVRHAWRRDLP